MGNPIEQSDKGAVQASDAKTRYELAKTATPTSKCLIAAPYFPCLWMNATSRSGSKSPGETFWLDDLMIPRFWVLVTLSSMLFCCTVLYLFIRRLHL
jgi:hypothetical protein